MSLANTFNHIYELCVNEGSGHPHITVDPSIVGVVIPSHLYDLAKVTFNIRPEALQSMFVDDTGVSFTTRFHGKSFNAFVPMSSILSLQDNHSIYFTMNDLRHIEIVDPEELFNSQSIPFPAAIKSIPESAKGKLQLIVNNPNPIPSNKPRAVLTLVS